MKKALVLCLAFLGMSPGLAAHPVDQETAKAVAVKFMKASDMTMVSSYLTEKGTPALYVFNMADGFVIVAADDCETPIVGYSREGRFDPNDVPIQMEEYLQDFVARIQYGIESHVVADEVTAKQWELVKATGRLNDNKSAKAMEPLITTKWHQGCLYNSLCPPIESQPCGHAEVGCVAVAMGQIMNYWRFPEGGNGSHTYYTNTGTYSAAFGNTKYDYELMPTALSDSSSDEEVAAVATLLYHCGVSVDMNYTASGSGAHSSDVPNALMHYFKYSDEMYRETLKNNIDEWLEKVRNCLDNRRPVLYSGLGSSGHAFVCDGYDGNDLLHFNWGWGGNGDGYFAIGSLNPLGHNYNNSNSAIFDIVPNFTQHQVSATASPQNGGTIEGQGLYNSGQQCHLTAIPADNYHFQCWTRNNFIVCYDSIYSFFTDDEIDDLTAVFSLDPVHTITAEYHYDPNDPNNQSVALSWGNRDDFTWPLLATLNIKCRVIATNGDYLYTNAGSNKFKKYTMNGEFIQQHSISDFPGIDYPLSLSCSEHLFYCNSSSFQRVYQINMEAQSIIKDIPTNQRTLFCSFDKTNNGIWICEHNNEDQSNRLKQINTNGTTINSGMRLPNGIVPNGGACVTDAVGNTHVLLKTQSGLVYDYDVSNKRFSNVCLANLKSSYGCCIGTYQGETALFVCYENDIKIFKVLNKFEQILHYRIYRIDHKGNTVILSDDVNSSFYIDSTWNDADVGLYRFGVSEVYLNGSESEIVWSNPLTKGNYDIDEHTDPHEDTVQKVFENGQIVIIKEEKRYSITGQEIRKKN